MKESSQSSRRRFLQASAVAALASSALTRKSTAQPAKDGKYNIIYLHSHDSGRYLRP